MGSASSINFQRLSVKAAKILVYGEDEAEYLQFPQIRELGAFRVQNPGIGLGKPNPGVSEP